LQDLDYKSRPIRETSELMGCPKACLAPYGIAEPAANTANSGPCAQFTQFADDKPAAGPKHPRHFAQSGAGILNETKHRHGDDGIERVGCERQSLCFRHVERDVLALLQRALPASRDHIRRGVYAGDNGASLCKFHYQNAIAASDIENAQAGRRPDQIEDKILFKGVRDAPKSASAP
jgi:hypothetical protein